MWKCWDRAATSHQAASEQGAHQVMFGSECRNWRSPAPGESSLTRHQFGQSTHLSCSWCQSSAGAGRQHFTAPAAVSWSIPAKEQREAVWPQTAASPRLDHRSKLGRGECYKRCLCVCIEQSPGAQLETLMNTKIKMLNSLSAFLMTITVHYPRFTDEDVETLRIPRSLSAKRQSSSSSHGASPLPSFHTWYQISMQMM